MKKAFIFPGQGSQIIGMGKDIAENFTSVKRVFEEVNDALGQNLSEIIFHGNIEELSLTENTQPALMAVSLAIIRVLTEEFKINLAEKIDFVAGHSLGEYSAYAAAESFSISDTAKLLRIRGKAMQQAVSPGEGAMVALLGADINQAVSISEQASESGICDIANDNCPGQIVLSGENSGIDNAIRIASEQGFKTIKLQVSAPFHSRLMEPAKLVMKEALDNVSINMPTISLIANVTASPVKSTSEIKELLVTQVTGRVRWCETINYLKSQNVTQLIEIGSGKVLANLTKRIDKEIAAISVNSVEDIKTLLELLK
ncbi:MAG: ACP S-malonyltransferase [Alphaproteobacteria bacterium]